MKVLYSFRTEKQKMPDPVILFENVRRLHNEFQEKPHEFYQKYKEWLRPMNQLRNGHFFSMNWDGKKFNFTEEYVQKSELKLEMEYIDENFVRISFNTTEYLPYRVDSGTIHPLFTEKWGKNTLQTQTCKWKPNRNKKMRYWPYMTVWKNNNTYMPSVWTNLNYIDKNERLFLECRAPTWDESVLLTVESRRTNLWTSTAWRK